MGGFITFPLYKSLINLFARDGNVSLNKKDKLNYHISYKSNNEDIDNYGQVKLNTKTLMLYSKNK